MAAASWIKDVLAEHDVGFQELHHRVAFTAQEVAQLEHVSGHRMAKVVVVLADGRPAELILPASRRVVLERVQKLLGAAQVRLASEDETAKIFTDCETGAIPALRHWKDVTVLMDASMATRGDLVFQAGTHEDVIRMKFQDWFGLVNPLIGWFTETAQTGRRPGAAEQQATGVADWEGSAEAVAEEARRESGLPGGGKSRVDIVELTGVYPASGPYPEGKAAVRTPAQFVHGQVDEEGHDVEGGSGLRYMGEGILLGSGSGAPSGRTGKETTRSMRARELMAKPVMTVNRDASLADVARTMVDHSAGCVPVVDKKGKVCGIIAQSDLFDQQQVAPCSMELLLHMFTVSSTPDATAKARKDARTTTAGAIMHTEVITALEETPVEEIARQMLRYDIDHIPVVRDGVPVGMVARHDFLRLIAAEPAAV